MTDTSAREASAPFEPLIGISALAMWLDVSEHTVKKRVTRGPDSGLVPRFIRVNGVRPQPSGDGWLSGLGVGARKHRSRRSAD